jgi:hypothetical protein
MSAAAGPTYPVAGAGRNDFQSHVDRSGISPGAVPADSRPARPEAGSPLIAQARACQGTEVLARVGNGVILASEVMPAYHEIMARIPNSELAALPKDRLEREKRSLLARLLQGQVQTKLIYQDAKRTIPEERFPEIEKKIADFFVNEELPKRIEKAGVATAAEFDEKLRAMGSSLERMKRSFVQQAVAQQWLQGQREADPEVSHGEMLDYYDEHRADYETPARARWEMISVGIPRYSDGRRAYAKLAQMGNQVMQGRSIAEVLAARADDGLECRGGVQGWVTQGGLEVSETIEEGIFTLPVGLPSRIFRDANAYHIIRVLEREPRKENLFAEAPGIQKEIREKLQQLRRDEQTEEYLARLKQQFPVWTIFDDDPELAELRRESDPSRN